MCRKKRSRYFNSRMDFNHFPFVCAAARSPAKLEAAVTTIAAPVDASKICNVVLQEAKSVLSTP